MRTLMSKGMALVIAIAPVAASAATLPTALAVASQAFDAAQLHGDGKALGSLLADDYLLLNGSGSEEDRAAFIGDYTDPGFHLDPFVVRHPIVRVWTGGAVLGGVTRLAGVSGGKRFEQCIRFTDVWSDRGGRWLVALTHVSKSPADACSGS
jgi:hypothetical protein